MKSKPPKDIESLDDSLFKYSSKGFNLKISDNSLVFTFYTFPTHVMISEKRRRKRDENGNTTNSRIAGTPAYAKINSQNIYNSKYNKFTQAKVIQHIKSYLASNMKQGVAELGLICTNLVRKYPVVISAEVYAPYSLGGCRYVAGNFKQVPSRAWDIGNFGWIWSKCFDDVLQEIGIIKNDSVDYVRGTGGITYHPTAESEFETRRIVFTVKWG